MTEPKSFKSDYNNAMKENPEVKVFLASGTVYLGEPAVCFCSRITAPKTISCIFLSVQYNKEEIKT